MTPGDKPMEPQGEKGPTGPPPKPSDMHSPPRSGSAIIWLNQRADKAAQKVFEYEEMSNEERLEHHLLRAHHHILAARDLTYGTTTIEKVYNGKKLNRTLNKLNNLLFYVRRRNRKRVDDNVAKSRLDRWM